MCGIGRVGSNVAKELLKTRRAIVVVESDRAALDLWLEHYPDTLYLHADAADDDALRMAGADEIVSPDFTGGMRIVSAMVRPHVINFMDQMLLTDEGLRVEEVQVPLHYAATPVSALVPKSRDYILVASHAQGKWVFHPADEHLVRGGASLIFMTNPGGRVHLEQLLKG